MKLVTNSLVHVKSIHQLAIYTMTNATVCHLQHLKKKKRIIEWVTVSPASP